MSIYRVVYDDDENKIYEGEFEGDLREGRGSLYYKNGVLKYTGEWKNDNPNGMGVLFYESGVKFYEGYWDCGSACGKGVLFTEDGRKDYEGDFLNSKKNGQGILYYDNGFKYSGGFVDDEIEGEGTLYFPTGEINYRGQWVKSKKNGFGTLFERDNILLYQGEFVDDKRCGRGKSYYINGVLEFDGAWNDDLKDGAGVLYDKEGKKIFEGFLSRGKLLDSNIVKIAKDETKISNNLYEYANNIEVSVTDQHGENILVDKVVFEEESCLENLPTKEHKREAMNNEVKYNDFIIKDVDDEIEETTIRADDIDIDRIISLNTIDNKSDEKEKEEKIQEIQDIIETSKANEVIVKEQDDEVNELCENMIIDEAYIEVNQDNDIEKLESVKDVEVRIEKDKVYNYVEIGDYIYKGQFNDGDRTGIGEVFYNKKLKYYGYLREGIFEGEGELYDAVEKIEYKGTFKNGLRNGYGKSYDSFGNTIYEGDWLNDYQDGNGKLLNSNGDTIFNGRFFKGKALGLGISIDDQIESILYKELEGMVGLEEVKDEVAKLVSFLKVQILRQRVSYKTMNIPYVFTFEGNIGVGKEEVAKILGKIYYTLGLIPEYNFIQKDLSDALEYSHDGDIEKSMDKFDGGVLYLSNLYDSDFEGNVSLVRSKSAADNVINLIDYSNGHFIIIFSGDEELIEAMIHSKKELGRLVGKSITFFDYSVEEMMDYITKLSESQDYIMNDDLLLEIQNYFEELLANEKYCNRNSEFIKDFFNEIVREQCIRIDSFGLTDVISLKILEKQDFDKIKDKICF